MYNYGMAVATALLTFVSPCVLPLLPVYITYFAGGGKSSKLKTFFNALAFCIGFSIFFLAVFTSLSFANFTIKRFVDGYKHQVFGISGAILICLGLKFMGFLHLPFMEKGVTIKTKTENLNIFNAFILGLVYSLSIGSCAFVFLSFDLINVIINTGVNSHIQGILIGVFFTVTLDLLFLACSMFINQLKGVFSFIKRHYRVINLISGGLMVLLGFLVAIGFTEVISKLLT